ncbi:dehalogenase [Dehalococcoides sp.]|jgi:predicted membrane protein|uniref:dehalogenase n=1 Tax=Dehalococcoides sp. TaxID=1966486 RepID=UPI003566592E
MWFFIGILIGALVLGFIWWLRRKNLNLTWYEWVLGILGLLLLVFTLQNFMGSFEEIESKAAYMFLLITGLPSLILLALTWQLAARRLAKA